MPCQTGWVTRTQYLVAASIDGYIADQHNSLDWLFEAEARATDAAAAERGKRFAGFFAEVGAMAMGAATYEWVLEHERLLDEPEKWQRYYGDVPSWVFTHRDLLRIPGAHADFVSGNVVSVHQRMTAAAAGKNIWVIGGGDLAGQFADQGLLDEIILAVAPVTLGGGAPLLPRRLAAGQLTLTDCEQDGTFAFLTYRVATG